MAGCKNSDARELFRKNPVAQFVDGFFFFFALGVLQFLNAVQDLTEIARRVNCHLIADAGAEFSRELNPEHGRFTFEIELSVLYEFLQRNDFLLLPGINTADYRRHPPAIELDDYPPSPPH